MTEDFFRARIDGMIDLRHPLAVLAARMPWREIEAALAEKFARRAREGRKLEGLDLFGGQIEFAPSGPSRAGRPRIPIRRMVSLIYLKHMAGLSDGATLERWSESPLWQYFSGSDYYEHRLPSDGAQLVRFRRALGEDGMERLLAATVEAALSIGAVEPKSVERVIVDTTVAEKAVAWPNDSRLLEVARERMVEEARRAGVRFRQTHAAEAKRLRFEAGRLARARRSRPLGKVIRRQCTILGRLNRHIGRAIERGEVKSGCRERLVEWQGRAQRIERQRPADRNKRYALHAPEVECIGRGKARDPWEFGVKTVVVVTHRECFVIGARRFPGNPWDGHLLQSALEQAGILTEAAGRPIREAYVDRGFRGQEVEADNPRQRIVHQGKWAELSEEERERLKRRQAIEPVIGHLKSDHGMRPRAITGCIATGSRARSAMRCT